MLSEMLSVGRVRAMELSRMFWLRLKVPLSVRPMSLNVLLYDTLLVRVLWVRLSGLYMLVRLLRS